MEVQDTPLPPCPHYLPVYRSLRPPAVLVLVMLKMSCRSPTLSMVLSMSMQGQKKILQRQQHRWKRHPHIDHAGNQTVDTPTVKTRQRTQQGAQQRRQGG